MESSWRDSSDIPKSIQSSWRNFGRCSKPAVGKYEAPQTSGLSRVPGSSHKLSISYKPLCSESGIFSDPPSVSGILRAAREVSVGLVRVGRIVSWGIWEEIFLVIFMITLPNGVFSLCTGLRFIRSKSQNYLFFLFSCLPPHFFPSFLTPSPSPSSLHLLSLFFSSFFSSSFFIPQSPAVLFNKQPPTVKACGRATVAGSWSLLESWSPMHLLKISDPYCSAFI